MFRLTALCLLSCLLVPAAAHAAADQGGRMPGHGHGMPSMNQTYSDRAYLSAMIAHHEAAIDMSEAVRKNGKERKVRKWADDVIDTQHKEIKEMRELLGRMGGEDAQAADAMRREMRDMMAGGLDADADRNFVSMMVGHHAGAIYMATDALVKSDNDKIVELSRDIIREQAKEIADYREWLREKRK